RADRQDRLLVRPFDLDELAQQRDLVELDGARVEPPCLAALFEGERPDVAESFEEQAGGVAGGRLEFNLLANLQWPGLLAALPGDQVALGAGGRVALEPKAQAPLRLRQG